MVMVKGLSRGRLLLSVQRYYASEIYKFDAEKQSHKVHQALGEVEWETIFFFMGLFMLVYGVEQAGLLSMLGQELLNFTEGDIAFTAILVLWYLQFLTIVDNIPFVATMIHCFNLETELGGFEASFPSGGPYRWRMFGGNGSLVGASANVMVASFAEREASHFILEIYEARLSINDCHNCDCSCICGVCLPPLKNIIHALPDWMCVRMSGKGQLLLKHRLENRRCFTLMSQN